jgi:iron complex transport system permease protein
MEKRAKPSNKRTLIIFAVLLVLIGGSVCLYIYARTYAKADRLGLPLSGQAFSNIMSRTIPALIGMSVAAAVIAVVSLSFQTVTKSRVLTPAMIGFDSVFVGTQTILVFFFGSASKIFANPYINYLISAAAMVLISLLMFGAVLRKNRNNIVFLLMFGLVLSGIVRSGSSYLQVIMDNNEYNQVRAATAVSINNMNTDIIFLAAPIMLAVVTTILFRHKTYNVMALGSSHAKNLGVAYEKEINFNLIVIAIGMSVTTALIGSITFLGLLAVNIAREIFKTYKHFILFIGTGLLSSLALILGQSIVELVQFAVPVTVIIDLVGCSYMFYLIIRGNRV